MASLVDHRDILGDFEQLKTLDIPQYDFAHYPTHPTKYKRACPFYLGCILHLCDASVHERVLESILIEMAAVTIDSPIQLFLEECSYLRHPDINCTSPRYDQRNEFSIRTSGETMDMIKNIRNSLVPAAIRAPPNSPLDIDDLL
jgi:hypothetical protein